MHAILFPDLRRSRRDPSTSFPAIGSYSWLHRTIVIFVTSISKGVTRVCQATLMEQVPETCWRSFCWILPLSHTSSHKGANARPATGWMYSVALSSLCNNRSPVISSTPLSSCLETQQQPSCSGVQPKCETRAISCYQQRKRTPAKSKTREKVRKDKQKAVVCDQRL